MHGKNSSCFFYIKFNSKSVIITVAKKSHFFIVFLTNFDFSITYNYLTTECGKVFTLSALSFVYSYVKDTYYEGSLKKIKVKTECQTQFFFLENQRMRHVLK